MNPFEQIVVTPFLDTQHNKLLKDKSHSYLERVFLQYIVQSNISGADTEGSLFVQKCTRTCCKLEVAKYQINHDFGDTLYFLII